FWIDVHAVSNARFAAFVAATGHATDAERYGWSFVFGGLLPDDFPPTRGVAQTPWWRQVEGADWRHPEGPHSDLAERADHPRARRLLARRPRLLPLGRRAPADGGRVGVRGARRTGAATLSVGGRADPRRRAPHERLAGPVPHPQYVRGRSFWHRAGARVPPQ